MKVIEIKENQKAKWNDLVKANLNSSLLQSFVWGEFQKSLNRKIWRLVVTEKEKWLGLALVVQYNLPFKKSYFYCPQGPIIGKLKINPPTGGQKAKILEMLLSKIKEIAKKEKAIFLRIDPAVSIQNSEFNIQQPGFVKAKKEVQPKNTLVLDITKPEDEILSQMHHKTRYNIRLAQRKGVKIRPSTDLKDVKIFWDLMIETTQREDFKSHPEKYYQKQIQILGKENLAQLFLAEYQGKIIAAIIVSFFGSKAIYLHGASLYQYREVMAPHLLQWQALLEAKKRNCLSYDFWGIAPQNKPDHSWVGITRFKKGFGGQEIHYLGAWDLAFQPFWYKIYNLTKNILMG